VRAEATERTGGGTPRDGIMRIQQPGNVRRCLFAVQLGEVASGRRPVIGIHKRPDQHASVVLDPGFVKSRESLAPLFR
jgi:hypothetical protein